MRIFHYHPDTGVFLGEGVADQSPLEPGVWLIPAYATKKVPPTPTEGKQAVMVGTTWKLQPIEVPPPPPQEPEIAPVTESTLPATDSAAFQEMTTEQKLNAFGLSVVELKELFGIS